jgi:hypothetical protein
MRQRAVRIARIFPFKGRTMTGQLRQAAETLAREPFEVRIRRFPRHYRRRLRKLVVGSRSLTDLLYSFPAAAFVLVADRRAPNRCGEALRRAKAGAPLAVVANLLDLPLWTRRLPPEAFAQPFGALPGDEEFSRRIANMLPSKTEAASIWLRSVAFGHEACGQAMALWLAGRQIAASSGQGGLPLLPLAAYAWFSQEAPEEVGRQLIGVPWHARMPFRTALGETRFWLERVVMDYCLEPQDGAGAWFKMQRSAGFRFLPLRSAEELREEGERMDHCVATYAAKAAAGACMIYSIRRGGKRVATMEIVPGKGVPVIAQLFGPGNTDPGEAVQRAAQGWLAKRGRYPAARAERIADLPVRSSRWQAVWQPYCAAKPQFSGYLLRGAREALVRLDADIQALARWQTAA